MGLIIGLILVRELDKQLGFGELITRRLSDSRRGKNTQRPLADLFRHSCHTLQKNSEQIESSWNISNRWQIGGRASRSGAFVCHCPAVSHQE
jgi:hypothetical protein